MRRETRPETFVLGVAPRSHTPGMWTLTSFTIPGHTDPVHCTKNTTARLARSAGVSRSSRDNSLPEMRRTSRLSGVLQAVERHVSSVRSRNHRAIVTHARKTITTPIQTSRPPVWVPTPEGNPLLPSAHTAHKLVHAAESTAAPRGWLVAGWSLAGHWTLSWKWSTGVMGTSLYRHTWVNST